MLTPSAKMSSSQLFQTQSQAEVTRGLEFAEKAQAFDDQIAKLSQATALCNKRLELQQAKYLRLKASIPF